MKDHREQEGIMGQSYMSGDFRGAIVNIRIMLNNLQQNINNIPTEDVDNQWKLVQLIAQLNHALQQVPETRHEQAGAVAQTAKVLVDAAASDKPNKTLLEIKGQGLEQAAQNLADVLPSVVSIVAQIVTIVMKLG